MTVESELDVILDVRGLEIEARGEDGKPTTIVDRVGFRLRKGEVLGLVGESGAGKSTIGLAALGHTRDGCRISGGEVLFRGRDIRRMSRVERRSLRGREIAYLAQSAAAAFNPAMTVMRQVCETAIRHGVMTAAEARRSAVELFRELELPDPERFGERYPHQVSGGQLQRAMAAMAMIARPAVLVFDEPTTALDVTTQVEVLAAFRRLIREHGTAALYITHDLAVLAQIADRVMVLRDGRMVELGETRRILQNPVEDYTRRLVAERVTSHIPPVRRLERPEPVLSASHIVAGYDRTRRVLDDVSFDLRRGETLAVVGESGSGKSTLARVVMGLLPPQSGGIRFDGEMLSAQTARRRKEQLRRVQMIYQVPDVALNPHHTVLEAIGRPVRFYFGRTRREVRDRVLELLDQMELPAEFVSRRTSELSGGQKQRVSIARALAAEPDVVICDEVTSALDRLVGEGILDLLARLQQDLGIAYLFITHDLSTVRRIANEVTVMLRGRIIATGATTEVFAAPRHAYTEKLLSSMPEMRVGWLDEVLAGRGVR